MGQRRTVKSFSSISEAWSIVWNAVWRIRNRGGQWLKQLQEDGRSSCVGLSAALTTARTTVVRDGGQVLKIPPGQ